MRLNDRNVAALALPERGQKTYMDPSLPGFGVRVSQGGAKTFILMVGAKRQRISLGRYPIVSLHSARTRALKLLSDRQLGIVAKPSPAFATVKDEYLGRRDGEVRAATRQGDRYLFKHFEPLERRKIAEITPEAIEHILDEIAAPSTRRSAFIRISGLMSFAVRRGYLEKSPVAALTAPDDQEPRHRVLSPEELRKLLTWARIRRLAGDQYGTILELLIYTLQRRMQIAGLTVANVDFNANTLTWKPAQMKSGRRHTIPMSAHVRSILESMSPSPLYFPNRLGQVFCGWSYHFRKLSTEIGLSNFVLHDVRRSGATFWQSELQIPITTTERLLSHSAITGGLVGVYQRHNYMREMHAAVEAWDDYLDRLVGAS